MSFFYLFIFINKLIFEQELLHLIYYLKKHPCTRKPQFFFFMFLNCVSVCVYVCVCALSQAPLAKGHHLAHE